MPFFRLLSSKRTGLCNPSRIKLRFTRSGTLAAIPTVNTGERLGYSKVRLHEKRKIASEDESRQHAAEKRKVERHEATEKETVRQIRNLLNGFLFLILTAGTKKIILLHFLCLLIT